MIRKLLFGLLFLLSIQVFAQDQKWSVEANYPISLGDPLGNDNPGIADLGIKYRFLDLNRVKIGVGLNIGVFHDNIKSFDGINGVPDSFDFNETNWLFQPKIFAEYKIPGIPKLIPSVGIGYAVVNSNFEGRDNGDNFDTSTSNGGLNINIGLSYNFTKSFFVQMQYDNIHFREKINNSTRKSNLGFLKVGVGFRF